MFLSHLSLANYRNYGRLELELPAPVVLIQGDNGQGKSNLLEAIYFLATTRSLRAGSDRELISWETLEDSIPFARVAGAVSRSRGDLRVEVVIRPEPSERRFAAPEMAAGQSAVPIPFLSKRIKINGVPRRALDLMGQINVVMFTPEDLELVTGSPSVRRRHLDAMNCQVDARYCRALGQYNRVLSQRNHLLKQIREGQQRPETLEFWSDELAKSGSYLVACRRAAVADLSERVKGYFRRLTGSGKELRVAYRSTVDEALEDAANPEAGEGGADPLERERTRFLDALARHRRREMAQAVTLVGPHRDDMLFLADGREMGVYGSRGEQRAVALALKLGEVEFMQAATGERPILLLDDVMSELDPSRRALLLEIIDPAGQTILTATDFQPFSPAFLSRSALFRIHGGAVSPLVPPGEAGYNQA